LPNYKPETATQCILTDWVKKLHDFLTLNDKEILEHSGKISAKMAKELAEVETE